MTQRQLLVGVAICLFIAALGICLLMGGVVALSEFS
jgi:hypothetical protein